MDGFAKYIVAVSKLTPDEGQAVEAVQKKLDELIDAHVGLFIQILEEKNKEWGEVARSVNKITEEVKAELEDRKFNATPKQ
jgi:predicted AlkP superfamily phosphohydrolase/phosphomutase